MKISIVVATRNRSDLIGDCLMGLQRLRGDCEILIVDQSTDGATAELAARYAGADTRVRYIPTATIGASRARNLGIAVSRGDIIAFTDDDCVPAEDWAEQIIRVFERSPDVSAVFGRCLPWGEVHPGERPVALKDDMRTRVYRGRGNPWRLGHGNNMAFRRRTLDMIGYFDEGLGPGTPLCAAEDADLMYRLLKAGRKAVYSPDPVIYHKQFRHGEDLWKLERGYGIGAGGFYAKHLASGDLYVLPLLLERWWTVGIRHIIYGMMTLRAAHVRLGCYRIAFPVVGMWMARARTDCGSRGRRNADAASAGKQYDGCVGGSVYQRSVRYATQMSDIVTRRSRSSGRNPGGGPEH